MNSLTAIDGEPHRILAAPLGRLLMVHAATAAIYLAHDEHAVLGLPTLDHWDWLKRVGRARMIDGPAGQDADAEERSPQERRTAPIDVACDLLDSNQIPNGAKSIAIWLHANWKGELLSRHGAAPNANTLKRWRTLRTKAKRQDASPPPSPSTSE